MTSRRPTGQPISDAIYGLIVSGGVAAAAGEHGSVSDVVVTVAIATVVYWFAEAYAEVLGRIVTVTSESAPSAVLRILAERRALVLASAIPVIAMVVVCALGANTNTSINTGLATAAVLLGILGWVAARLRGHAPLWQLGAALVATSLGAIMIALKALIHG